MVLANASATQSHGLSNLLDTSPVSHTTFVFKVMPKAEMNPQNSTLALSIIRQLYTVKLSTPDSIANTDVSLSSTLATILMAVELTYALISCTLTTSNNFTGGFSTGFGMGHIPGAAESYNMSAVASSSNPRTHRDGSGYKSNISTMGGTNIGTKSSIGHGLHVKTPSLEDGLTDGPMQLRPLQQVLESRTIVQGGDHRYWGDGDSVSSDGHDDSGIVRYTEYTVSHDKAPILQKHSPYTL
jgi:hypothetical protein